MEVAPESAACSAEHDGQTFYFCSKSCQAKFVMDPANYIGMPVSHHHAPLELSARTVAGGISAIVALLAVYFGLITLLSGWEFTLDQFREFWPYLVTLAVGFGIQVGLYLHLRRAVHGTQGSGKVLAVSGTTSGTAMVSCCAHYLVNLLPALGATGFVAIIGQYQVEFFWLGLAANAAGIAYVGRRVFQYATVE
jgi:Cu+-exporting ATPase